MNIKGAIFVTTHSRATDLNNCLNRIVAANSTYGFPLIVIHQLGHVEVENVISSWSDHIDVLVRTKAQGKTPLENINLNAILAREVAFTWLGSDWCLGVEDDVLIGLDSIQFVTRMYEKYRNNLFFRGVNLGSDIEFNEADVAKYMKMSYGLHGQASMITRKTWNRLNIEKFRLRVGDVGLDAHMEHWVKTGFMCTPKLSRYLDNGWNGTHSSTDPNDDYYLGLQRSFFDGIFEGSYRESNFSIKWRKDCYKFNYFLVIPRFLENKMRHIRWKVGNYIRN